MFSIKHGTHALPISTDALRLIQMRASARSSDCGGVANSASHNAIPPSQRTELTIDQSPTQSATRRRSPIADVRVLRSSRAISIWQLLCAACVQPLWSRNRPKTSTSSRPPLPHISHNAAHYWCCMSRCLACFAPSRLAPFSNVKNCTLARCRLFRNRQTCRKSARLPPARMLIAPQ
jgi:hypothetical protein